MKDKILKNNLKGINMKNKYLETQLKQQIKKIVSEQTSNDKEEISSHELFLKYNHIRSYVTKFGPGYYTYINTKNNKRYITRLCLTPSGNLICKYGNTGIRKARPINDHSDLILHSKDFKPIKI